MELSLTTKRALTALLVAILWPLVYVWAVWCIATGDRVAALERERTAAIESRIERQIADGSAAAFLTLKGDIPNLDVNGFLAWRAQQNKAAPAPVVPTIPFDVKTPVVSTAKKQ